MSVGSRPRRALGAVVATVLACTTLALLPLTFAPAATAGTVDGPGFEQPAVGECRALTMEELYGKSNNEAPIDCTQPHTSRVIATGRLPQGVGWDASLWRLDRIAVGICDPRWKQSLGGSYLSRAMSAYSWGWFMPNANQRERGARWIRCDLVLWGGSSLVRLPPDAEPALGAQPHPDRIAACLKAKSLVDTICARAHAWRATGTFTIRQEAYPTERQFRRAALRRCPAQVTTDNSFRWTYRGPNRWRLGDHVVTCFSRSRS